MNTSLLLTLFNIVNCLELALIEFCYLIIAKSRLSLDEAGLLLITQKCLRSIKHACAPSLLSSISSSFSLSREHQSHPALFPPPFLPLPLPLYLTQNA